MLKTNKLKNKKRFIKYIYWMSKEEFNKAKEDLKIEGFNVSGAKRFPCEALKASGGKLLFVSPEVWSCSCIRQGSWYRESNKFGEYVMVWWIGFFGPVDKSHF